MREEVLTVVNILEYILPQHFFFLIEMSEIKLKASEYCFKHFG